MIPVFDQSRGQYPPEDQVESSKPYIWVSKPATYGGMREVLVTKHDAVGLSGTPFKITKDKNAKVWTVYRMEEDGTASVECGRESLTEAKHYAVQRLRGDINSPDDLIGYHVYIPKRVASVSLVDPNDPFSGMTSDGYLTNGHFFVRVGVIPDMRKLDYPPVYHGEDALYSDEDRKPAWIIGLFSHPKLPRKLLRVEAGGLSNFFNRKYMDAILTVYHDVMPFLVDQGSHSLLVFRNNTDVVGGVFPLIVNDAVELDAASFFDFLS